MGQNGADYSEIWVRQDAYPRLEKNASCTAWKGEKRSPRVQLEGLAKRASLKTIPDRIVLEYDLGEASLTSLRWGKMVQTTPRYGSAKVHTPDWKNASCTAWKVKKVREGTT